MSPNTAANLAAYGYSGTSGNLTTGASNSIAIVNNTTTQWSEKMHQKQGNIALGDGSVQQVSSARLRSEILSNAPPDIGAAGAAGASIVLLFP